MYVRGTPVNIDGHTSGTPGPAAVTPKRIDIPKPPGRGGGTTFARALTFRNLDDANDLHVYFDEAGTYLTVPKATEKTFYGTFPHFLVAASLSTVQWECTAIVAA